MNSFANLKVEDGKEINEKGKDLIANLKLDSNNDSMGSLKELSDRDYFIRGNTLLEQASKWSTEENTEEHYLKLFSDVIEAYTKALVRLGEFDSILEYKNARSNAYRCRGEYMQAKGIHNDLVRTDFMAAILDNPEYHKNQYNIASITPNHPSTTIFKMECYKKAIDKKSDVAKYYNGRGDVFKYNNEPEKAADDYLHALELNPLCETTKSKKQIFDIIEKLSVDRQKALLRECLDDTTTLGMRMWKPENALIPTVRFFNYEPNEVEWIKCNPNKGTLKAIRDQLKKIDPDWVDPYVTVTPIISTVEDEKSTYTSLKPGSSNGVDI